MLLKKVVHLPFINQILRGINWRLPAFLSRRFYSIGTYDSQILARDLRWPDFSKVFEYVKTSRVEGDFLEFGVHVGTSFNVSYDQAQKNGLKNMRFFALDGFLGQPETEGNKFKGDAMASREVFTRAIRRVGVDMRRVRIIEGLYADSLTDSVRQRHNLTSAAVVHIDCDLYVSVKDALRFIEPIVHPRSIIIFGDWHYFETIYPVEHPEDWGEQKAFREWPLSGFFDEFFDNAESRAFMMRDMPPVTSGQ